MRCNQVYAGLISHIEIGVDLPVCHPYVDIHRPQIVHIKMKKGAYTSIVRSHMFFIRIHVQIPVGIVSRHLKGKLNVSIHLIELVHEVNILWQILRTLESAAVFSNVVLEYLRHLLNLRIQPVIEIFDIFLVTDVSRTYSPLGGDIAFQNLCKCIWGKELAPCLINIVRSMYSFFIQVWKLSKERCLVFASCFN